MKQIVNHRIDGKDGRPILIDSFFKKNGSKKALVIFAHGFKGFKDWGCWNQLAEKFSEAGFVFVKFNFSFNGTTHEKPADFADLEAFGKNDYIKELNDLECVIDWIEKENEQIEESEKNLENIYLIGHSRGGGMAILKAYEDKRIKKLATWSAINKLGVMWTPDTYKTWERDGVIYVMNSRTNQNMPLYFSLHQTLLDNPERLDIPRAVKKLNIPFLIVHGKEDEAVPFFCGEEMKQWNDAAHFFAVENGTHTFGSKHPWNEKNLPAHLDAVAEKTIEFFKD